MEAHEFEAIADTTSVNLFDQEPIFVDGLDKPLKIYVDTALPDHDTLVQLIETNGGKVMNDPECGFYISENYVPNKTSIRPSWVNDCVESRHQLRLAGYKVSPELETGVVDAQQGVVGSTADEDAAVAEALTVAERAVETQAELGDDVAYGPSYTINRPDIPPPVPSADRPVSRPPFTADEDEYIMEYVRYNPKLRETHSLYAEMAKDIPGRTGNSIRFRYKQHLSKRLGYFYKTNANNELFRDESGNLVVTEDVLPPTLKSKFTAKDDYTLAMELRKMFYTMDNRGADPVQMPSTYRVGDRSGPISKDFYHSFHQNNQNHPLSSWRDRFRKFLKMYGIDAYIEYYETTLNEGKEPEPVKTMRTPKSLMDDVYGSAAKRRRMDSDAFPYDETLSHELVEQGREEAENDENELDLATIPWPPAIATSDLFTQTFFEFPDLVSFIGAITEVIETEFQESQADQLVEALHKVAGVKKQLGTKIITSICGDIALIPKYFNYAFAYNQNPPEDVSGIWTKKDDDALKNGIDLDRVEKLHGRARMDLRMHFIDKQLV